MFLRQIVSAIYSFILFTVWHSLVEFRFLMSVCEAWQRIIVQNLCTVGKNA